MAGTGRRKEVLAVTDHHRDVVFPLDFSFKAAVTFSDLLREKPRSRDWKAMLDLEEEEMELEDSLVHLPLSASTALRVNNNMLTSWEGFWSSLGDLYIDPAATLHWLDVSFNDLRSIDQVLLQLPNLMMLYMHGNNISKLNEVDKLASLPRLKTLTLHGNPIETTSGYRTHIVYSLPQLQTLDFSGVTKGEKQLATTWGRKKPKKQIKE